jgi:hypothetical protein
MWGRNIDNIKVEAKVGVEILLLMHSKSFILEFGLVC